MPRSRLQVVPDPWVVSLESLRRLTLHGQVRYACPRKGTDLAAPLEVAASAMKPTLTVHNDPCPTQRPNCDLDKAQNAPISL